MRTLVFLTILTAFVLCGLCGCAETNESMLVEEAAVNIVSVFPTPGTLITPSDTIIVTFDDVVRDVSTSLGNVYIVGKQVKIRGPYTNIFHKEDYIINIGLAWRGGAQTLGYILRPPDTDPPQIIESDIKDGDLIDISGLDLIHWGKDVINFDLNANAKIDIEFSEEVTGDIALQNEDGEDVGWLGSVEGNYARLELVRGKELANGVIYIITGKVSDAAGNEFTFKIQFETYIHMGFASTDASCRIYSSYLRRWELATSRSPTT